MLSALVSPTLIKKSDSRVFCGSRHSKKSESLISSQESPRKTISPIKKNLVTIGSQ